MNFDIDIFLQLIINGILLGGLYAAMALGFSTIWGVMRLINLAHGEFIMMGAYVAWFLFNPMREQNLSLAASLDPIPLYAVEISVTGITFTLLALLLAYYLSEQLLTAYINNSVLRRAGAVVASLIIFYLIYSLWSSNDFAPVDISMMLIIFVSLALSIGFIISHIFLQGTFSWDRKYSEEELKKKPSSLESLKNSLDSMNLSRIWQRRVIAYSIGILISYGVYSLWQSLEFPSLDPFLSLPIIFILFFALGYVIQNSFLNRLVEGPYLTMLLVTFSLAIVLQNIGLQIFAADPRRINVEYGRALNFGDVTVPPTKLVTVIVSIVMVAGLVAFLRYTRIGYAIRAAAQNKTAARLMGINIKETYAITFAISIAMTAMAGAMMGTFVPIAPILGPPWTLRAFSIVALGGLGKVEGVIAGGMVLGLAESFVGFYIGTNWQLPVAFIILVIVLVVRPQGITGGLLITEED